ncbi:MAG: hypothetical protein CM15mP79_2750 [Methanobacteriota archaeon]|nr:MAG: hypothetical protein CM15mP79_2750 [Euryarchaeota archaeon]
MQGPWRHPHRRLCPHPGASYDGTPTGLFGAAGCFSLQTWKQINAGEGGIIVTDDEDLAARAILASGAYMLHAQHGTPPSEDVIQRWAPHTPNCSMRLNELAAAIALPQLASLEERNDAWRAIYNRLEAGVRVLPNLRVPRTLDEVVHAPTSFQFMQTCRLRSLNTSGGCAERGVPIKWFGRPQATGFTSVHRHWGYVEARAAEGRCGLGRIVRHPPSERLTEERGGTIVRFDSPSITDGPNPVPRPRHRRVGRCPRRPMRRRRSIVVSDVDFRPRPSLHGRLLPSLPSDLASSSSTSSDQMS